MAAATMDAVELRASAEDEASESRAAVQRVGRLWRLTCIDDHVRAWPRRLVAMSSLLEELARRESAVRRRIEEIRERITQLNARLSRTSRRSVGKPF